MKTRNLAFLRPEQVIDEIQRFPVVYLPIGPLEWHGPHLPLGVDPLNAENAAKLAAERVGGLILPTLYWGTERERDAQMLDWIGLDPQTYVVGMDFPANTMPSMYCSEEIFALLIREQLRLVGKMGFRLAVVVTGHAATNQVQTLQRLAAEFNGETQLRVIVVLPFLTNSAGVMEVGHASLIETAMMQALHPETVRLENLPTLPETLRNADWAVVDYETFLGNPSPDRTVNQKDDPRRAEVGQGRYTINQAVEQIVQMVEEAFNAL